MTSVTAGLKPLVNHVSVKLDLHLTANRQLNDTFPTCSHLLTATMSTKKSHIEQTEEAPHVDPALSFGKSNPESDVTIILPKTDPLESNQESGATANVRKFDGLDGLEDIALFSNAGEPFFLVAGQCVNTRQQLELALTKQEKNRMNLILKQCRALPWLEYEKPAKKIVTMTESEKAEEDEREFEDDLKALNLAVLTTTEENKTGSSTPIVYVESTLKADPNMPRIKEIRKQLEKLRNQQQSNKLAVQPLADQLYIKRQATFDISRSPSGASVASKTRSNHKYQMRSSSTGPQPVAISPSHIEHNMYSSRNQSSSSIASSGYKTGRLRPYEDQSLQELPITDQIGDLLMQFPHSPQEKRLQNSGTISYLVTISPTANSRCCKVQPLVPNTRSIPSPKSARFSSQALRK